MPSRLASDRPIKNVIGSVNQTLLQRRGWAGRWVGGGGRGGRVGRTLGVVQIEKRERNGEVIHSSFFALPGGAQQQLQRCTIVVFCCLFVQGPGG